jgi:2-aminoadipate transaminase
LGEQALVLGSFSKVLAPGLRLGYLLAPAALYPKLLQAKQAADLHTPTFNQRLVHQVLATGMLPAHVAATRERYRVQRDAMAAALLQHMPAGVHWQVPQGGMFFVPGTTFFPQGGHAHTLRLSFVTVPPARIAEGIAALGAVLRAA